MATATVTVPTFDPIVLNVPDDITDPCPFVEYTFSVEVSGGAGMYNYQWTDNFGEVYGIGNVQTVRPGFTTTYYVEVFDRCGETAIDSVTVTITSPPLEPYVLGDTTICLGDSALLTAGATGGFGDYYFFWPHSGETTSEVWVSPRQTSAIRVIVSDDCQTYTVDAFGNVEVVQPIANFEVSSGTLFEDLPIQFTNTTFGGDTYFWEFGDGQTSTQVHASNTYDEPGTYYITLYAENEIGCRDSITKPIKILPEFYIYVPNAITPNNDGNNDFFSASTVNVVSLEVRIFNRWGEELFYSDDKRFSWDGTYNGAPVPDGVYVYKLKYLSINGDDETIYGHVTVLR
jgi:gliding motility-associated-like protein